MAHPYKDKATTDRDRAKHRAWGGRGMADIAGRIPGSAGQAMQALQSRMSGFGGDPRAYLSAMRGPNVRQVPVAMPSMPTPPVMPQQAMPVQGGSVHGGVMKRGGRAGRKK